MNYSLYVISNKPEKFSAIKSSLEPEEVTYFDGTGYPNFSALVNACIAQATTETVIIMSDKVMPTAEHVSRTLSLLDSGFAFVALCRFAFFGFRKQLYRTLGMMDERYTGGGFEDYDFYVRLIEANIAAYITEEVPYDRGVSSWNYEESGKFWPVKWQHIWHPSQPKIPIRLIRNLPEEKYSYDLGPEQTVKWLDKSHSVIAYHKDVHPFYYNMVIKSADLSNTAIFAVNSPGNSDNYHVCHVDTTAYKSYAHFFNTCVKNTFGSSIIILINQTEITDNKIELLQQKINSGFAAVMLNGLDSCAFNTSLFKKIGLFDEDFIGQRFLTYDILMRCAKYDLPVFFEPTLNENKLWANDLHDEHAWNNKWKLPDTLGDPIIQYKQDITDLFDDASIIFSSGKQSSYVSGMDPMAAIVYALGSSNKFDNINQ